jgi:hypothetical protein
VTPGTFAGLTAATAVIRHLVADPLASMGGRFSTPRSDLEVRVGGAWTSNPPANYGLLVGGVVALVGVARDSYQRAVVRRHPPGQGRGYRYF